VQSWPEQEAEAIAWTQDNAASTPTIDALNPVETKAEFCKIILRNAEQFKAMMVMVGWSQHVRGQLKAMTLEGLKTANPAAMMNATRALKGM
jgi:hypothetical protein